MNVGAADAVGACISGSDANQARALAVACVWTSSPCPHLALVVPDIAALASATIAPVRFPRVVRFHELVSCGKISATVVVARLLGFGSAAVDEGVGSGARIVLKATDVVRQIMEPVRRDARRGRA